MPPAARVGMSPGEREETAAERSHRDRPFLLSPSLSPERSSRRKHDDDDDK